MLVQFLFVTVFGWATWVAFGRIWMGILVALGAGLPMIARTASIYLMEPGPRKDRVYLTCFLIMLAVPMLMIFAFAVVYDIPGR